jgi:segregation and condensation protein B
MRTLQQRGFIDVSGDKKVEGEHGTRYVTTALFLEKMGISSLDDLEPLAPFLPADIADIPQFDDIRKSNRGINQEQLEAEYVG